MHKSLEAIQARRHHNNHAYLASNTVQSHSYSNITIQGHRPLGQSSTTHLPPLEARHPALTKSSVAIKHIQRPLQSPRAFFGARGKITKLLFPKQGSSQVRPRLHTKHEQWPHSGHQCRNIVRAQFTHCVPFTPPFRRQHIQDVVPPQVQVDMRPKKASKEGRHHNSQDCKIVTCSQGPSRSTRGAQHSKSACICVRYI